MLQKSILLLSLLLSQSAFGDWRDSYKCQEKVRIRNMTNGNVTFTFYAVKDLIGSRKQIRLVKNQRIDELIYWNEKHCSSYGFGEVWFDASTKPGEQRKKYKLRSGNWYRFEAKSNELIDLFYYCNYDRCSKRTRIQVY